MSAHTHAPSEVIDDAIAAMALGALDASERPTIDAHLASCPACREDLAELQRVVCGIGLSVAEEAPPPSLRDKVMSITAVGAAASTPSARAASVPASGPMRGKTLDFPQRQRTPVIPWLAAAAAIALAAASSFYAMTARQQTTDALRQQAASDARAAALQTQMSALDARMTIMSAPDAQKVDLQAQPDAPGSTARVYMSPKRGMVLTAEHLPALAAGRTYQLWVVTKQAPVSVGVFTVQADGSVTGVMPLTADATLNPVAVAVTIEPAGGMPSPTGPKVLVGMLTPQ